MRAAPIALVALLAACPRPLPTRPPLPTASHPSAAAADVPRRASVAPVALRDLPRLFAEGRERDVDLDGLPDRVREVALLPRSSPDPTLPAAVLVAHALPDGRFALDDDVTRASLRALCPEDPPLTYRPVEREDGFERAERLNALLLDAYCQQAWGRDLADLTAALHALRRTVGDALRADQIDAIVQVLREFASPITLEPLRAAALPTFPDHREGSAPSAPPSAEPPVAPACQRVLADNARAVAQADALGARVTPPDGGETYSLSAQYVDAAQCAARGVEVWAVRLAQPRLQREELTLAATLTHERPGARASLRLDPFSYGQFAHRWVTVGAVFDWDGDGALEAAVRFHGWEHEGDGTGGVRLFRVRNGAIVPYAPAASLGPIAGVRDVDGDGRPDLVLPSPWHAVETCGPGPHEVPGVDAVAHALPDGGFSTDDAVARGYLAGRCEAALRDGLPDREESYPSLVALACARRAGASAEATVAALRARHRDAPRLNRGAACFTFHDLALNALIAR